MTAPAIPPARFNPASCDQREAARDHVAKLRQDGGTYRSIAATAAVSPDTVHRLASGRGRAQPGTATAVLTVTSRTLQRARLDATGTRLRLRALHVMGHDADRIARATGISSKTIRWHRRCKRTWSITKRRCEIGRPKMQCKNPSA